MPSRLAESKGCAVGVIIRVTALVEDSMDHPVSRTMALVLAHGFEKA